jgi:hypothetical protein
MPPALALQYGDYDLPDKKYYLPDFSQKTPGFLIKMKEAAVNRFSSIRF